MSSQQTINFYQELGLGRDESTEELHRKATHVARQWRQRASLSGRNGREAAEKLKIARAAIEIFCNDETRQNYDATLAFTPATESEEIDWIDEAWKYYFADDYDAARAAAQQARSFDGRNPRSYVISAYIEILHGDTKLALEYANQAYILDLDQENAIDVNMVRGGAYLTLDENEKALTNYRRVLDIASDSYFPVVVLSAAWAYIKMRRYDEAVELCLTALGRDPDIASSTIQGVSKPYFVAIDHLCLTFDLQEYQLSSWIENGKINEEKIDESLRLLNKQLTTLDAWRIVDEAHTRLCDYINLHITRLELIRKRMQEIYDMPVEVPPIQRPDKPLRKPHWIPLAFYIYVAVAFGLAGIFLPYLPGLLMEPLPILGIVHWTRRSRRHKESVQTYKRETERAEREVLNASRRLEEQQAAAREAYQDEIKEIEKQLKECKSA
ncbi:hypothetical protein QUV91_06710 [Actinomyces viscosus]|uniref:Tetratricopeptide repeat protein n=1 Tax=Actinomyces viscosus TaxID=1656 RepID=A0ABT7TY73_ACTVI|nr:hypothetical protein [Actinomyces viscosus]MDM8076741.1 hypothetical protein [Actinomyces viscosus]